ncbi:CHAT domain-containing protein (plasmid) [Rhodococcus opacus]|uniref:CHAT domain-containing protein n=1 Tax=Rhodococcus opacus TaxID=37919 RepID=UPI0034D1C4AA
MSLRYQNFDLFIEPSNGSYQAQVLTSPVGEAPSWGFDVPFTDLHIENFLLKVNARRHLRVRSSAAESMARTIEDFGGQLYAAVFGGDIAECLTRSRDAVEPDGGLRIRLRLDERCPELVNLPWEYLYDPRNRRYLCLSERTPLVRYMPLRSRVSPLAVAAPLRILTVVADPAGSDADSLEVEHEWEILKAALSELIDAGAVQLDRLTSSTLESLNDRLSCEVQYHVLHFIGHGRFSSASGQGELLFESDLGGPRPVSAFELATVLDDHRSLSLVVLNSCEGARTSVSDPFAGTAQTLIHRGIPACVAMQFEISDAAAIAFSAAFYRALAANDPLDGAVTAARRAIYAKGNHIEWATPVLFTRAADTRIFTVDPRSRSASVGSTKFPEVPTALEPVNAPEVPTALEPVNAPEVPAALEPVNAPEPAKLAWKPLAVPPPPASPLRRGTVVFWGGNNWRKLRVPRLRVSKAIAIAAGSEHNLALTEKGAVIAWGDNSGGLCSLPKWRLSGVKAIEASEMHSLALTASGTVIAWGLNTSGQCDVPEGLSGVVAIAGGAMHSLALTEKGTVVAWGYHDGHGVLEGLPRVVAIAARHFQSLALTEDGTVFELNTYEPKWRLSGVVAIAAGRKNILALTASGTVVGWGDNSQGQCNVPEGLSGVVAIAAGDAHCVALTASGTVVGWGDNSQGQCNVPEGLSGVVAIAAGDAHNLALKPGD